MADDLILRSAYMKIADDMMVRALAHDLGISKNEIIRAIIHSKLESWRESSDLEKIRQEITDALADTSTKPKNVVYRVPAARRVEVEPSNAPK